METIEDLKRELDKAHREIEKLDSELNKLRETFTVRVRKRFYDGRMTYRPENRLALIFARMLKKRNLDTATLKVLATAGFELDVNYQNDSDIFAKLI